MSTGVFRPYPPPQQPAVMVTPGQVGLVLRAAAQIAAAYLRAGVSPQAVPQFFTPGQPLGSPIGQTAASLAAYVRASIAPALPALGIAALIPVAAAFVPPAAMARVPTVQPAMVRLQTPGVAAFLSPNTTDAPIAGPPILGGFARPAYPVQELEPGVAPLIPVAAVSVPPSMIARSPVLAYPTQQPDQGGAWLAAIPTDYLLPAPAQQPTRSAYPTQPVAQLGAWLTTPVAQGLIAPSAVLQVPRVLYPTQLLLQGIAPLLAVAPNAPPPFAQTLLAAYVRAFNPLQLQPRAVLGAPPQFVLPTAVQGLLYRTSYPFQQPRNFGAAGLPTVQALVSDPRYVIARLTVRTFTASRLPRAFSVVRAEARNFTRSAVSNRRFDAKDPSEKVTLTFDFTTDLPTGVTLSGTPTVQVSTVFGTDASPSSILNGSASLDGTAKQVIVPVQAGVDGCEYRVSARCATTNALLYLELDAVLPVRS